MKAAAVAAMVTASAATPGAVPAEHAAPAPAPTRLPGFAAALANRPLQGGPSAWPEGDASAAWAAIVRAPPQERQAARWTLAMARIARGEGPEALGILELMSADDPDLALVPAWQRARGVALVLIGRDREAVDALTTPMLTRDPESCLWRMRALSMTTAGARASLGALRCAMPALNARGAVEQRPFRLAAVRSAIAIGRADAATGWLAMLPDGDPETNLLRGKAFYALDRAQEGRLRLARVQLAGTPEQRIEARLSGIEGGIATGTLPAAEARKQLDTLRYAWRGGDVERRTLTLAMRLSDEAHDLPGSLSAGAILFRYFDLGSGSAPLAARFARDLSGVLAPDSKMPVDRAAGLFWDYRDLAPTGIEGLRLTEGLIARLQGAGLYARAADLLQHRLDLGAQDVERGALSVRIANMRILAGNPEAAIRTLRSTDTSPYPAAMIAERRRVEAAALDLLGKPAEAIAALDELPGADGERAEIYWRARDWQRLAAIGEPVLPRGRLNAVGQAVVLRHAIALAMLGREDALARLGARYRASFAGLPTAPTFAMLTDAPGAAEGADLAKAMAALPSASPAGAFADLLDQGAAAMPAKT